MYIDEILKTKVGTINWDFFEPKETILTMLSLLFIIFISKKYIGNYNNKLIATITLLLIIFLVLIGINNKLKTNLYLSEQFVKPEKIVNELNTGDIVIFRCYEYDSIGTWIIQGIPLIQNFYSTHVGIIYKDYKNNKVYIVESNKDEHYCELSKKVKGGTQVMDFVNRINKTKVHRVYVIKSNMHKYVTNNQLMKAIIKYKDYAFLQDGIYCVNFITKILIESGILKEENVIPYLMDDFIDSRNYKMPVKFEKPIKIREPDFYWCI